MDGPNSSGHGSALSGGGGLNRNFRQRRPRELKSLPERCALGTADFGRTRKHIKDCDDSQG
jgi:hypothetical protein